MSTRIINIPINEVEEIRAAVESRAPKAPYAARREFAAREMQEEAGARGYTELVIETVSACSRNLGEVKRAVIPLVGRET